MLDITEESEVEGSTEIEFQCQSCDQSNVVDALGVKTTNKLLGTIPIWVTRETAVKCPDCEATFSTRTRFNELDDLSTDDLAGLFKLRIGLVEKFLVIAGWLVIVMGPVALGLFIAAWFFVPKSTKGWRRATNIGLVVSTIISIIMIAAVISGN